MALVNRIPTDLQAVFLASNSGEEVHKPPASKSAFKVFRNLLGGMKELRNRRYTNISRSLGMNSSGTFPSESSRFNESAEYNEIVDISPQKWVENLLLRRGYSTKRYNTVTTGYYNKPTALQLASYSGKVVELCTTKQDEEALREMLSCGISPNACNIHGESLMHKACRLGYHQVLSVFLELDPELKICDAQGRTLLHDACWGARPSFQVFKLLIQREPDLLFMADCRGACPLQYVKKEHFGFWIDYLDWNADTFWPCRSETLPEPARVDKPPHSRVILNPPNALTCDLALLVASGRMTPKEVLVLLSSANKESLGRHEEAYATEYFSCESVEEDSCGDDSCMSEEDSSEGDSTECSLYSSEDIELLRELGELLAL